MVGHRKMSSGKFFGRDLLNPFLENFMIYYDDCAFKYNIFRFSHLIFIKEVDTFRVAL